MAFEISFYRAGAGMIACALATDATQITPQGNNLVHLAGCTNNLDVRKNFLEILTDKAQAEEAYRVMIERSADLPLLWRGRTRNFG